MLPGMASWSPPLLRLETRSLKASSFHFCACREENMSVFPWKSVLPGHCCLWFCWICNSNRSSLFSSKWKRRSRWRPIYSTINIFKDKGEVRISRTHTTLFSVIQISNFFSCADGDVLEEVCLGFRVLQPEHPSLSWFELWICLSLYNSFMFRFTGCQVLSGILVKVYPDLFTFSWEIRISHTILASS